MPHTMLGSRGYGGTSLQGAHTLPETTRCVNRQMQKSLIGFVTEGFRKYEIRRKGSILPGEKPGRFHRRGIILT